MAGSSHLELVPFPFHADFYDCWGFFIMNRTLFDCGFQQKVELRNGDRLDVTATLPKAVKLKYDSVRCGICSQSFFGCDCSAAQSAVCCKSLAAAPDFSKRPPC